MGSLHACGRWRQAAAALLAGAGFPGRGSRWPPGLPAGLGMLQRYTVLERAHRDKESGGVKKKKGTSGSRRRHQSAAVDDGISPRQLPPASHLKVPPFIVSKLPFPESHFAVACALSHRIKQSCTATSPSTPSLHVLLRGASMISARWNLAVGPVIMVAGAFGAVVTATLGYQLTTYKKESPSDEKLKA